MTKEEKEERERDLWSMYHDENENLLEEINLESEPISIDEEMKRLYPNKKLHEDAIKKGEALKLFSSQIDDSERLYIDMNKVKGPKVGEKYVMLR